MDVHYSSSPTSAAVPLLLPSSTHTDTRRNGLWRDVWAETKMIWYIAAPAVLTSAFQYSLAFLTQTLVGHIGTLELAAFGTQNLVIGGIGFGIMLGMGSALETLCGQAFGAGKFEMLGIYMQRSWVILLSSVLLILPVYIFSSSLLKLVGQSVDIADLAGKLSIWMIPQLFAYALNFPIQKFLQAQSKVLAMMWISFGVLVIHMFLSWLCIIKLDMGLLGASLTLNFSWWLMVLSQLAYILSGRFKESWTGFSWLAFADLSGFLRLSFASAVMLCLEYWLYMVLIITVGLLKNPQIEVDAASICVRVSNELGAGNPRAAKFSVCVMVAISLIIQSTLAIIIWVTRNDYPAIFTDDKLVMAEVSRISLYLCVSLFLSSIQPILSGVAVGAGWQALIAYVNVACYYLVGLSAAIVLGFIFNLGLEVSVTGISFCTIRKAGLEIEDLGSVRD
ncbi:hypothetical protein GIB67_002777 [Kingdonia uniflora]|uniref:Protein DETOXIFICATION n=1 Tax=Kingdonia uniflora TaxID=39325 RepID=A0A7J7LSQ0_9MAGN|nr:hypothetical protein GIB67_002777 [Kingdonia uniflora]